jgi:hypothetical protein
MTAAAGIEIGTGASTALGMSKAYGANPGILAAGTAASLFASSTATAGQDFRTGLQSLLAALGQVTDSAAGLTSGTSSSLISSSGSTARAGSSIQTNSAQAAGTASLQEQGLATQKDATGKERLVSAQAEPAASANRSPAETAQAELKSKSETSKSEEKKTITKSANVSSATSQGSDSISSVQSAGIAAVTLPETLSIANAVSPQSDPVLAVAGSASYSSGGTTLSAQTALTPASLPTTTAAGFATASGASSPLDSKAASGSREATDSAAQQGTELDKSTLMPKQTSTASDLVASRKSGSSEEVSHATELPDTRENASLAGMPLVASSEPVETVESGQVQPQLSQISAQSAQQTPNVISAPEPVQSIAPSQLPISAVTAKSVSAPALSEPVQAANSASAVASIHGTASTDISSQNEVERVDPGPQGSVPPSAPSKANLSLTESQNSILEVAANSSLASAATTSQSITPATQLTPNELQSIDPGQSNLQNSSEKLSAASEIPVGLSPAPAVQPLQNLSSASNSGLIGGQSLAANESSTESKAFASKPVMETVPQANPTSIISAAQSATAAVEPSQVETLTAALGTDAEQGKVPAATERSVTAQSSAVHEDLPTGLSQSIQIAVSDSPKVQAVEVSQSASSVPTANSGQSVTETSEPDQSVAAGGESSPVAASGQSANAEAAPTNTVSNAAVDRHSSESSASSLNLESAVETKQSAASVPTVSSGIFRGETVSSAPVQLPAHSESVAERTPNRISSRLNPVQPLTKIQNSVEIVDSERVEPSAAASGQHLSVAPAESTQKEAPSASTVTGVLNPVVAATSDAASVASAGAGLTQVPDAEKSAASSNAKTVVSGVSRTASRTKGSNAVQPGQTVASGESSGLSAAASDGLRGLAGMQGTGTAAHQAGSKSAAAVESNSAETFAALDATAAPGKPAWIHTGAQQAEAGFQDPDLGWVGVRADSSGGGIHAELVASSTDASQALSGHMAGLNAFLAEHHTPVETLTLSTTGGGMESASDQGAGGGMHQGTGEQAGRQLAQSEGSLTSSHAQLSETALSKPVWPTGSDESAQRAQWVGGHISVMA